MWFSAPTEPCILALGMRRIAYMRSEGTAHQGAHGFTISRPLPGMGIQRWYALAPLEQGKAAASALSCGFRGLRAFASRR